MRKRSTKAKTSQPSTGNIRIIAGKHRGRKLPVVMAEGLRPTTDRIKETVFNWLMPYVGQSHCLDSFAGAGSLGFEAYSRGADKVTLLELNKAAAKQLKANKALLSADCLTVIETDTLAFLKTPPRSSDERYNLVFIDPPFRQGLAAKTIALLNNQWLSESAIVYLENGKDETDITIPTNWQLLKEKVAGQVQSRLFKVV